MSHNNTQILPNSQDIPGLFSVYKHPGETLAVLVNRFRREQWVEQNVPVTYAGRLDPMADGVMLLLAGEACKNKDNYLGLDKTYTFEVLFGVATDTFDMLGVITAVSEVLPQEQEIEEVLDEVKSKTSFSYPPFSSKPVDGVPLFMRAKAGTLPENLPTIQGEIKSLILKDYKVSTFGETIKKSLEIIKKVEGDFRQKEIVEGWEEFLKERSGTKCVVATFETSVSSGVYVRSIATFIGKALHAPALAYSITRKRVGGFDLNE